MPDPTPRRPRCDRCALPARTCLCALVVPVANETEVLVLQHPDEATQAKGSVRLLALSLARCRVVVGEAFAEDELLSLLDGDVSGTSLLYPRDTATDVRADRRATAGGVPRRLVVLDGTWRKTLRMLHANPLLQTLPRWSIDDAAPGGYGALRKAARPGQLSTLEATCAALDRIERASGRYRPLLASFEAFVADRLELAAQGLRAAP